MTKLRLIFENEKQLFKIAVGIAILWVIAQIVLIVCFWGHPQVSDMGAYISMAQHCFANGQWYPMTEHVYSNFIWAPGFINYLILQLHIFGTINLNAVLNLFLNIAMLFEVYYLGQKFFSKRTGLFSAIIFCLLYSNLLIVLGANTEVPFMFLCLSALCLIFSGKWKYIILAAILFALANWIRPLVIIFLFASVVYFVITKTKFYNYIALIVPYIFVLFIIGTVTEKKIGYFVYQSTTSGANLIQTAHDKAYGGVQTYLHRDTSSTCYIENANELTFIQRDSTYKARAVEWIKKNPMRYTVLYFKKFVGLYIEDSWADRSHFEGAAMVQGFVAGHVDKNTFMLRILHMGSRSLVYYFVMILFLISMWVNRKELLSIKGLLLLIFISGTMMTCILAVSPRYHYPFMFAIILYAAYGIDTLLERKRQHL
jgi:ABC-type multidrug transport system fused ATPase/permease subunit